MNNLLDHRIQNERIQASLTKNIEQLFPISANGKTLTISNVKINDTLKETDFPAQKEVKLNRKT